MLTEDTPTKTILKRITVFLCLALLVFVSGPAALADDVPTASAVISPTDFLAPGEATLSVTVNNRSKANLTELRISADANAKGDSLGTLESGKSGFYELQVSVSKNALESGKVTAYISFKLNGKTQRMQAAAQVKKVNAVPETRLSCHFAKTAVHEGEPVQAEYTLKNTGAVAILNACIEDSPLNFVSESFFLAPGEEKYLTCVRTLTKNTVTAPRVIYTSEESGTRYVENAVGAKLTVSSDNIVVTVTPSEKTVSYRERVFFTVKVQNLSPFSYTACILESPVFGRIMDFPTELEPGAAVIRTLETRHITENAESTFTLTAREAGGKQVNFVSHPVILTVSASAARQPVLSVAADRNPEAPFIITVTGADTDLKNVRLSEKSLGTIKEIAYLPANADTVLRPHLDVTEGENYVFSIEWKTDSETKSVTAAPAKSLVGTAEKATSGLSRFTNAAFYTIVHATGLSAAILYGCIFIIILILVVTFVHRIGKKRRAKRELRESLGRTNKFAPVRTRDSEKE